MILLCLAVVGGLAVYYSYGFFVKLIQFVSFALRSTAIIQPLLHFSLDFTLNMLHCMGNIVFNGIYVFLKLALIVGEIAIKFLPTFLRVAKTVISFIHWSISQVWRGVFVMDCQFLTNISWTMICCSVLLYFQRLFGLDRNQNNSIRRGRQAPQGNRNNNLNDENPNQRRRAENDVINPPRRRNRLYPDLERLVQDEQNENSINENNQNENEEIHVQNRRNVAQENDNRHREYPQGEQNICIVCMENVRNVAVFPCGHIQLCQECVNVIMQRNKRCPLCQGRITEQRRVYL